MHNPIIKAETIFDYVIVDRVDVRRMTPKRYLQTYNGRDVKYYIDKDSRGSPVGTATDYELDYRGF
jgi:hypothetical protein